MPTDLNTIIDRLKQGDLRVLGDLPEVLGQTTVQEIISFRTKALPLIRTVDRDAARTVLAQINEAILKVEGILPVADEDTMTSGLLAHLHIHMDRMDEALRSLGRTNHRGRNRGQCRVHRSPDNDAQCCAAKGLQPFTINGHTIWAGTLKSAHKKYRTLEAQGKLPPAQ